MIRLTYFESTVITLNYPWKVVKDPPNKIPEIWFVRPITYVKYTRAVYYYTYGRSIYVNPSWAQPLWSYLIIINSWVEVIIICIYYVVHRATLLHMTRGMCEHHTSVIDIDLYNLYLKNHSPVWIKWHAHLKKFVCTTNMNLRQIIRENPIIYFVLSFDKI